MVSEDRLALSPLEVAKELGISKNLVYKMISDNEIPWIRAGGKRLLIPRKALEEWLNSGSKGKIPNE